MANVQNTSEYNFSDVSLNIGIYDANNVRTETFANVTTWRKGDTVKVEFITEADVQRIEAVPEYYTVDE
ncbi:MAG: FxLYD domain-containing protein [Collinsella sp.]|nr:FxLYD domain-containing protein [Collinsella sp.]